MEVAVTAKAAGLPREALGREPVSLRQGFVGRRLAATGQPAQRAPCLAECTAVIVSKFLIILKQGLLMFILHCAPQKCSRSW